MRIAVAGGTGVVGRYVVEVARERGHDVVILARSSGVDVITGSGLSGVLAGTNAVVDCTNVMTLSADKSRAFFETATCNLLAAEEANGVGHHVALSIVGIDGLDASYYAGKLAQERAVATGRVPSTIVRAVQFHEFVGQMLARMKGPVTVLPKMLMRPVAAREVGEYMVTVAEGDAAGRATDLVGPRDERLADLARRQLAFDGIRHRVVESRIPGAYGKGLASGRLRGAEPRLEGKLTFDDWLTTLDHPRP